MKPNKFFFLLEQILPENGQAAAVQVLPTDWLIYDEMTRAHRIANIRCCTVVTPVTVAIFSGPARLPSNALQEPAFHGKTFSVRETFFAHLCICLHWPKIALFVHFF